MEEPRTITLPWLCQLSRDDPDRWEKAHPSNYHVVYACPLCGWFQFHPLFYCGHCRGKLEKLGILKSYFEEWRKGKMTSGA